MALRVGPRGTEGCCECSVFIGCDCAEETAGLECRVRGGGATLCGFEEFTDPSSPPKKYRRSNLSGGYVLDRYSAPGCATLVQSGFVVCNWSGSCQYDAETCAADNDGQVECGGAPSTRCVESLNSDSGRTEVLTKTTRSWAATGACFLHTDGVSWVRYSVLDAVIQLADEDTEEDAIARAIAPGWSDWAPVDEFCQNPGCCQSAHEERVSGFGFVYIEAEFRVKKTGLTPGQAYDIAVDLYRRPYDSGPYELYATIELSATVDGSGILETNATAVPNDLGFQTYASSPARLTPVP